ncbi:conserved exported hypothetical protein [Candidatus Desulfosporosinus infrequens]|uniref:Lipoprotein n=1 Tax=Candidatus Desulfosporosinus infrequens TaxID=2043169 RepID=A0A2U3LQ12_9FIRM|nr:conserved exported hypothetical protein [Candidatus Desulfosporosinus infrequens]
MKKAMYLILTLTLLAFLGCSSPAKVNPNATGKPKVESAEDVAYKIIELSAYGQWDQLYAYLHPDVQGEYTKEIFITDSKEKGGMFALIKDYKVEAATLLPTWSNTKGDDKEYKNVAEVPFMLDFTNGSLIRTTMHLAKTPDGSWRYFWSPRGKLGM